MGKRDLSQELLQSVREMKAGRRGRAHRSGKSGSAMAKAKRDSLTAEARRQPMAAARDEKRKLKGADVEMSSGNVFADLGLPDADKLKIKSGLVIEITKAVRRLGLSQAEAGRRMSLSQPKVSGLFRGEFANVSERKLMECLNRLGYDVEIRAKPAVRRTGHLRPAAA